MNMTFVIMTPGFPGSLARTESRSVRRGLAVIGFVLGMGAGTSAHAAPAEWAYLWADQPFTASYAPNRIYQRNSSGAVNTVTRAGIGQYQAQLPNLGADAGTVHVTAYGSSTHTCKVSSWGPVGSDQRVNVRCFNLSGTLDDTLFTLSYTNPITPDGTMAYLWADQAAVTLQTPYTPLLPWQFNSTGAPNSVTRTGIGAYTASLPNVGSWSGHVQVTPYGTGSERCKVSNWNPVGSTLEVRVLCFASTGTPANSRFTLTYVIANSLIGAAAQFSALPSESGAYVWANEATSAFYVPNANYQWDDFSVLPGQITVSRAVKGSYTVDFTNHSLDWGHVQVTGYGAGSEYCKVAWWNNTDRVQVRCFDSSGQPADTRFTVSFLDHWQGF
jgi:hypothetical protein